MNEKSEKEWGDIVLDLSKGKGERVHAGFKLENALDDDSLRRLGKALMIDPSPIVRHEFAFSLGETKNPRIAIPYLKEAAKNDPNIFVRHEAIIAIGNLSHKDSIPFVKSFLDDFNLEIRESAEIALERLERIKD